MDNAAVTNIQTYGYSVKNKFWNDRIKSLIVKYIPDKVDIIENNKTDWIVWARLIEVGKKNKGLPYERDIYGHNWADNTVLNTLESMCLAVMVDSDGDREIMEAQEHLKEAIERWIPVLLDAVCEDGYFCPKVVLEDTPRWMNQAGGQPEDTHEGYLMGYFMETAITHHKYSKGKDFRLLDAACKMADLWVRSIGDPPKKEWVPDHEGIEIGLVKLADYLKLIKSDRFTEEYYNLAQWLVEHRGRTAVSDPYRQNGSPLSEHKEVHGHAVMAGYFYAGACEAGIRAGNDTYKQKLIELWHNAVDEKMYLTASVGAYKDETYGPSYILPNNSYSETCASCALLFYSDALNNWTKDGLYSNVSETAMYNAILGSKEIDGVNWYYRNPLDATELRELIGLDCCMSNLSRVILQMPTWMYSTDGKMLMIKQYVGSDIDVGEIAGVKVKVIQETDYPYDSKVKIIFKLDAPARFTVGFRVPNRNYSKLYSVKPEIKELQDFKLNGSSFDSAESEGYIFVDREWKDGDIVTFKLPVDIQRVYADARLKDDAGKVALKTGPIVYNAESYDEDLDKIVLPPNLPLKKVFDEKLLGGIMKIVSDSAESGKFTAIPNFARLNRGEGRSVVWVKESD